MTERTGLEGRTALVTGGGGGIGSATCRALAARGARVVVADIAVEAAEPVAAELPGAVAVRVDLADPASIAELHRHVAAELPPVQVLVNNAGVALVERFLDHEPDLAVWDRQWAINLRGPMLLARAVLPAMVESGWGRIVNISSDGARAGSAGEAVYSAVKAGLLGFTRSLAREVGRQGITVNAVCPGPTDTAMTRAVREESPRLLEALQRAIPLGRIGEPDDIAEAVAFLADASGGYLTGQSLSVSGGITMA
jgi:2-hydroxycyclohexanecarboxyl-CoA dehydrogenase